MIGFDKLGNLGRLGNQMFEYAALRGIAAKHKYEFCIPPSEHRGIENYSLHECFDLNHILTGYVKSKIYVEEKYFHFNEELFETCPDDVNLFGFFQTEKYFKNIKDTIFKDFQFRSEYLNPCKEFMTNFKGREPIMLHVRRGDSNLTDPRGFKWSYTQCGHQHPVQSLVYYEKALEKFDINQPVIVFSDSPEWVKEQEFFSDDRFFVSEPKEKYIDGSYTPYVDLCLMSLCSHAIIANSSMSWWGSWLINNPSKKIIAPKMWFGPAYADKDTKDLYCKDWIVL